jgi:hypothetical protein
MSTTKPYESSANQSLQKALYNISDAMNALNKAESHADSSSKQEIIHLQEQCAQIQKDLQKTYGDLWINIIK